jgi:hypothetical protein
VQVGNAEARLQAGVDAKLAGEIGVIAGPFRYSLKKAQLDHSPVGTEKVFWTLDGAEFFQDDDPTLIVVLQIPKAVEQVKIAAALQASHRFNLFVASLGAHIKYFSEQLANFFRKGAPAQDTHVWDITPNL